MIYRIANTEIFIKLLKHRDTGIDTFIEVDETGEPTIEKRSWHIGKEAKDTQHYLVKRPYGDKIIPIYTGQLEIF